MILIDSRTGSKELLPYIQKLGVQVELATLDFGDFAFSGNGPRGSVDIGIERKTLSDMLHCIDDARYAGHQLPGMMQMYDKVFLLVEGGFRPHEPSGILMTQYNNGWTELKYRSQKVMYAKLYRYLLSINLAGVMITYSRDVFGSAYNVVETYQYFQKKWDNHTALREIHKLNLPTLQRKPSLVRKWAASIESIGVKLSEAAERKFKTPIQLARADESDWMQLPNVGVATARKIVREVNGWKD